VPDVAPVPIPFAAGQASGLSELSGAQPAQINVLVDALQAVHQRPGIQAWSDFGTAPNASPVIGQFVWRTNLLFVCEDRTLWAMTAPGSFLDLGVTLGGTGRPIWSYDQQRVVVTGGGAPIKWEGVGVASELAPGAVAPDGSPLTLTHIAYSAQRFIGNVNNNAGIVQWTAPGPGAHGTWPIVGPYYAEAEASPDPLVALYANSNEVFTFGTETTQVYTPDAALAFAVAASLQVGCLTPYSVISDDGNFAWLDSERRIVQSNGREFKVLSSPGMAKDIANLTTTSDCWGARIKFEGFDLLVWSFPTEKRSIYYDKVTQKWGEFRSSDANGEWVAWLPTSYLYWNERNLHLVGLPDGRIAELTMEAATDMGQTLRGLSRTGFIDAGSFNRKKCERVDFQLRRDEGVGTLPTDARVEYRYRDTLGGWSPADSIALGGTYQPVATKWSKGIFRQRQHEISFTNANDFVLAGASMLIVDTGS
jgi:hypothetical protein